MLIALGSIRLITKGNQEALYAAKLYASDQKLNKF
jgi:hypothetical protein